MRNGSKKLIGKHARVNNKHLCAVIGAFMTGIRCYNSKFINSLLDTSNFYKEIHKNLGATINQITTGNFRKMKFYFPNDKEQQKIGEFFSKLDRQIELEEQKLEKLEELKKGYMQKIFSQELRFKDENGNDYPEWEEKLLSEIGDIVTGNTPSKKVEEYWESNDYIWVTPKDITNTKNIKNSFEKLSSKGFEKARKLPKNTLLVTCIASIGKNAILKKEGSCNQQINAVIPFSNSDIDYIYYAFDDLSKLMKKIAGKTATQIINKSFFENLSINLPFYQEQVKISKFLNGYDHLIDWQIKKIEYLELNKKGLLKKLLV